MRETYVFSIPRMSLNDWYAGKHWSNRQRYKDDVKTRLIAQRAPKLSGYFDLIEYEFVFKNRPLDCDNCVAMEKVITDCIFEKDDWKVLPSKKTTVKKGGDCDVTVVLTVHKEKTHS